MGFLNPEEAAVVERARRLGLISRDAPAYLHPDLCTLVSLALAVPTLGFSLLFVPILWVAQYDLTSRRIEALRLRLIDETTPLMTSEPGPA